MAFPPHYAILPSTICLGEKKGGKQSKEACTHTHTVEQEGINGKASLCSLHYY